MAGIGVINPGVEAIRNLAQIGYRAWIEGEKVRLRYEGTLDINLQVVKPLIETVRQHKDEVRNYLKTSCTVRRQRLSEVLWGSGDFHGGLCRIADLLQDHHENYPQEQVTIEVLVQAYRELGFEIVFKNGELWLKWNLALAEALLKGIQ